MDILKELHKMFLEIQKYTGAGPKEIAISRAAMNEFLVELSRCNDFQFTFNTENGMVGKYYGIPVKVYDGGTEKKISVIGERDVFKVQCGNFLTPYNDTKQYQYYYQDPVDCYRGNQRFAIVSDFDEMAMVGKPNENENITDEQLITLLNGGGFHAVV